MHTQRTRLHAQVRLDRSRGGRVAAAPRPCRNAGGRIVALSRVPPGTPRPACLLRLLLACLGCCLPAQPTVCLLRVLCATIQPILLRACSGFYVPQYSRAYCVPAQPSMCHNAAKPTVCLLSLLCATIQLSLLYACLSFSVMQYS